MMSTVSYRSYADDTRVLGRQPLAVARHAHLVPRALVLALGAVDGVRELLGEKSPSRRAATVPQTLDVVREELLDAHARVRVFDPHRAGEA